MPSASWAKLKTSFHSLEMTFHLRQVEGRSGTPLDPFACVVEEVEAEVEQARRHGSAVQQRIPLDQMPSTRPDDQRRQRGPERVALFAAIERQRAANRLEQVPLSVHDVRPGRRQGVLDIRHEDPGPRVQGVDHHLAVHRAGDFHTTIVEIGRGRGDLPGSRAYGRRPGKEVEGAPGFDGGEALPAPGQQSLSFGAEFLLKASHEFQRFRGQYPVAVSGSRTNDRERRCGGRRHRLFPCLEPIRASCMPSRIRLATST